MAKLPDVAVVKGIQKALIAIHVITGWALLDDDRLLQMFEALLFEKLRADYPTLNFDEIQYAFLHHSSGIKNWGASFNIPLMDEVLSAYLSARSRVSLLEEQNQPKEEKVESRPLTLAELEEWRQDTERMYNEGKLGTPLLPVMIYNYLVALDEIMLPAMQKHLYYRSARGMVSYLGEPERTKAALVLAKQIALSKYFDGRKTGKLDVGTIPAIPGGTEQSGCECPPPEVRE